MDWAKLRGSPWLLSGILTAFLALEYYVFGTHSYIQITHTLDLILPRFHLLATNLMNGGSAEWVPQIALGMSRGSLVTHPYHPSFLFGFLGSAWLSHLLQLVINFWVAGYFSFRLLNERARISWLPAWLGACTYLVMIAKSPLLQYFWAWSALVVVLFLFPRRTEHQNPMAFLGVSLLAILFSYCSDLAGTTVYLSVAILMWFLFFEPASNKKTYILLCVFFLVLGFSKYWEIARLLEEARYSLRAGSGASVWVGLRGYLGVVWNLLSANFAFLLIGLFALPFLERKCRRNVVTCLASILVITVVFQMYGAYYPLLKPVLGIFAEFHHSRFAALLSFFAMLLVATALDGFPKEAKVESQVNLKEIRTFSFRVRDVLAVGVVLALFFIQVETKATHFRKWLVENSSSNYLHNEKLAGLVEEDKDPFRVAVVRDEYSSLTSGLVQYFGMETLGGEGTISPKWIHQLWPAIEPGTQNYQVFELGLGRESEYRREEFESLVNLKLIGLLNVKYVFSKFPLHSKLLRKMEWDTGPRCAPSVSNISDLYCKLSERFRGGPLFMYENPYYVRRAFFSSEVRIFKSDQEIIENLNSDRTDPAILSLSLSDQPPEMPRARRKVQAEIRFSRQTSDEVELDVESASAGFLTLSNLYHPKWKVFVDGDERLVLRGYASLQSVALEAGRHRVKFSYVP